MEKKSMGQFIAVLRKAKGMTQRELAESLGVSDKAVSRWERDECAPDISALPVLGEIFDITVDELLRGERKTGEEVPTKGAREKSEKQLKRLIKLSRERFQKRSIISAGIAFCGLIMASVCNFAFLRSYLGFFLSLPFILAAVIFQSISIIDALSSLRDSEAQEDIITGEKRYYFQNTYIVFSLIIMIFMPCVAFVALGGEYYGVTFDSWLEFSFTISAIFALLLLMGYLAFMLLLKRTGVIPESETEKVKEPEIQALLKRQLKKAVALTAALIITGIGCNVVMDNVYDYEFTDLQEFKEFMETPMHDADYYVNPTMTVSVDAETVYGENYDDSSDYEVFYDENGNIISEEEALKEYIWSRDGSEVILEYVRRNETVSRISYKWEKDRDEPILQLVTNDSLNRNYKIVSTVNTLSFVIFIGGMMYIVAEYMKKKNDILGK